MAKARPMTPPSSSKGELLHNGFEHLIQHNNNTSYPREGAFSYEDSNQLQATPQSNIGTPTPAPVYRDEYAYASQPMYTYAQQAVGLGISNMDNHYGMSNDRQHYNSSYTGRGSPSPSMSTPGSEARTRSGMVIRPRHNATPTPTSNSRSKITKSLPKPAKQKKQKVKSEDKKKSGISKPLSALAQEWPHIAVADIDTYVNRSAEERQSEIAVGKNAGRVKRPMNSFMLYRKAYQELTKQWALQQNHQVVSQVCGESWPLEPEGIRNEFKEWARIERENHQNAHPGYKFTPAKAGGTKVSKRQATEEIESEESELEDYEWQTAGNGRGAKRSRRFRQETEDPDASYHPTRMPYGYDSRDSSVEPTLYHASSYQSSNPGRPLPTSYDPSHLQAGQYYAQNIRNGQLVNTEDIFMQKRPAPSSHYLETPPLDHFPAMQQYQQRVMHKTEPMDPALFAPASLYDDPFGVHANQQYFSGLPQAQTGWQTGYMNPGDLHNDGLSYGGAGVYDGLQLQDQNTQVLQGQQEGWQIETLDAGQQDFDRWMDEHQSR